MPRSIDEKLSKAMKCIEPSYTGKVTHDDTVACLETLIECIDEMNELWDSHFRAWERMQKVCRDFERVG